jgi:non-specific serine/threonine protein kinase
VARLVERSLVEPDFAGFDPRDRPEGASRASRAAGLPAARYRLLDTIRAFGAQRLAADPDEAASAEARYLEHFAALAVPRPEEKGPTRTAWVQRVEPEYANLVHAMDLALDRGARDIAFGLGEMTAYLWVQTGQWIEGLRRLEVLLASRSPETGAERTSPGRASEVRVLSQAGLIATILRVTDRGHALIAEAFTLGRELGEPGPLALVHESAAIQDIHDGDFDAAEKNLIQSRASFLAAEDRGGAAVCVGNLGIVESSRGNHAAALVHYREYLALSREMRDPLAEAKALGNIGWTAMAQGSIEEAKELLHKALALHEANRDFPGAAMANHHLGDIALGAGELATARSHLLAACRMRIRQGDRGGLLPTLLSMSRLAEAERDLDLAAEIVVGLLHVHDAGEMRLKPEAVQMLRDRQEAIGEKVGAERLAAAARASEARDLLRLADYVQAPAAPSVAAAGGR